MNFGDEFYKLNQELQGLAVDVIDEVLKSQSNKVYNVLLKTTPRNHGGLVNSLKLSKLDKKDSIGYKLEYYGYNEKGRPYAVIANSLNRGYLSPKDTLVHGTYFIDKAVSTLKGTDNLINKKWEEEVNKISTRGVNNGNWNRAWFKDY